MPKSVMMFHDLADGGLDFLGKQTPGARGAPDQLLATHHCHLTQGPARWPKRCREAYTVIVEERLRAEKACARTALVRAKPWAPLD